MKLKKILTVGLSLALVLGVTGCTSKKEEVKVKEKTETVVPGTDYAQNYKKVYNDYIFGLNNYSMYSTPETVTEYYTTNKYPGNEKYLEEVKVAYKDSRDKMQSFVDSLKNDVQAEDAELKKMNDKLIAEGEKTIKNIDMKLKKLEEIPKEAATKTQEEYIRLVNETTAIKGETENEFTKMIRNMNEKLGITQPMTK